MEKRIVRSERVFTISLWIIPMLFYLTFWGLDGAVWCADSDSYVNMHDCREPLYPVILALLRWIFSVGENVAEDSNISLTVMALFQSILAAIAASSLTSFLVKQFMPEAYYQDLLYGRKIYTEGGKRRVLSMRNRQRIRAYILLCIPLAVSLLNRFAAKRASMYSNSIMTEGIAISIYLLAFRFILDYALNGRLCTLLGSALMTFVGITVRKQMYVVLCLMLIAIIYRHSRMMLALFITILTVCFALLFDCTYNYAVRHSFIMHTEDNRFVTTMALYTAEREFSDHIEPELRGIFLGIYDECDRNRFLMHDAPCNWYDAVEHFSDNYDHIQLDTMQLMLEDYVDNNVYSGFKEHMTKTEKIDMIRNSFNRSLIPLEVGRLAKVFFFNCINGLINTVAKKNIILCIYACAVYAVFAFMIIIYLVKYHSISDADRYLDPDAGIKEYYMEHCHNRIILMLMTMLSIIGNVTLVSAVIFCQTRYMVYNMPLFYMTLYICISFAWNNRKKWRTHKMIGEENV